MSREATACVESSKPGTQKMEKLATEETCEAVDQDEEEDEEDEDEEDEDEFPRPIPWQKIEAQGLDCDYGLLFSRVEASRLFVQLEEEVEYFTGTDTSHVHVVLCQNVRFVPRHAKGNEDRWQTSGGNLMRRQ